MTDNADPPNPNSKDKQQEKGFWQKNCSLTLKGQAKGNNNVGPES
jgi:hypothetical protein